MRIKTESVCKKVNEGKVLPKVKAQEINGNHTEPTLMAIICGDAIRWRLKCNHWGVTGNNMHRWEA